MGGFTKRTLKGFHSTRSGKNERKKLGEKRKEKRIRSILTEGKNRSVVETKTATFTVTKEWSNVTGEERTSIWGAGGQNKSDCRNGVKRGSRESKDRYCGK